MRRSFLILGLGLVLAAAAFWASGGLAELQAAAVADQRAFQNAMAGALRRLRAHDPGALAALMLLTFGYGVFHAAGPGHGKVLLGGYGISRNVRLLPMLAIALAASLAQATTAVALVYSGVLLLGLTRDRMIGLTERIMAPASYGAIALVGLWLMLRGARALWRARGSAPGHGNDRGGHDHCLHDHGGHDHTGQDHGGQGHGGQDHCDHDLVLAKDGCGHRHGPSVVELAAIRSGRDAALLIGSIALRPCSGALLLLILTWQLHIGAAGVAGTYAMGFGTACVTLAVAGFSVWARAGTLVSVGRFRGAGAVLPLIEIAAGAVVALAAGQLLMTAI